MAKYYGLVGYKLSNVEIRPGVYGSDIVERTVYGDYERIDKKTENQGQVNDDIKINHRISFIADPFAIDNQFNIKYATHRGAKWSVTSIEEAYPRLILNLGGIYHDSH
ncbi:MAG: hypothetical protein IKR19_00590 [Acholeplasmatales bacterium]|nr:hypothetical protein [Acholeplasmatales bacterium]